MEHALALATLGALLALDHALWGQFMVSQPLVVGGLFGWLLGDVPLGLEAGAIAQLLWLGMIPVGAYIPSEHTVTGGVTVALSLWFVHSQGFAPQVSIVFALAAAIPAGLLAGRLDGGLRHWVNDRLARRAERLAQGGVTPRLGAYLSLALLPAFLRAWLVYLLWLGPGAWLATLVFRSLPAPALRGLEAAFWLLPALGFAVVAEMAWKEGFHLLMGGAFLAGLVVLALWPGGIWIWLGVAAGAAAVTSLARARPL